MKKSIIIGIIAFLIGGAFGCFISSKSGYLRSAKKDSVKDFIMENLVAPGVDFDIKSIKKESKISAVNVEVNGAEDILYTDKTGEVFYQKLFDKKMQEEQKKVEEEAKKELAEKIKLVPSISETESVFGSKDAELTIYEYSDFECPYCKMFYKTPKEIVEKNDGKVNLVFRHFPLPFHDPLATKEALAVECAAEQGRFWEYHDIVFKNTNSNGNGLQESDFYDFAKKLGLKTSQFKTCLDDKKYLEKIQSDTASGSASGVTGTPGSIVKNNKTGEAKFINGAADFDSVQAIVDELLTK